MFQDYKLDLPHIQVHLSLLQMLMFKLLEMNGMQDLMTYHQMAGTIEVTAKTVQGSNSNGTLSMQKYNKKQQVKL